jgi:hypothetical protein
MTAAFNTKKNKEFLWKVMYQNKLFEGLDNSLSQTIQLYFDNKMNEMDMKKKNTDTLISLNKRVVYDMMTDIKTKISPPPLHDTMITSQEIIQNRQHLFDQQLNSMKNEFDSLMHAPKPAVIDFSDKKPTVAAAAAASAIKNEDDNLDIERLLAETISKRENMVIAINDAEKNKAAMWVNNNREVNVSSAGAAAADSLAKPIKIGADIQDISFIENDDDSQKMKKNVRFHNINNFIPINVLESNIEEEGEDCSIDTNNIQLQLNAINEKLNKIMDLILQIKSTNNE